MRASVAACAAVVLRLAAACAADTMRGYVGQDIRAVVLTPTGFASPYC